jgi:hypothetical protein
MFSIGVRDEVSEALVLFGADWAAPEVGAQSRHEQGIRY